MGLFAKVADKKRASAPVKPKKATTWRVGDPAGDEVAKSVHALVELDAQSKAIEAKTKMHKTVVKSYAEKNFVADFTELGVPPETPMEVVNSDGEKVILVVQDRSGQYGLKEEQIEQFKQLLGADAVERLTYTETSFGFNRDVLAHP